MQATFGSSRALKNAVRPSMTPRADPQSADPGVHANATKCPRDLYFRNVLRRGLGILPHQGPNIPRPMKNSDHLQRLLRGIGYHKVLGIRLHHPESQRQRTQIRPDLSCQR